MIALLAGIFATRSAEGQQSGASASLTHVVSVTVSPRVKVEMRSGAATPLPASSTVKKALGITSAGTSLVVQANQSWSIAIKTAGAQSRPTVGAGSAVIVMPTETSNVPVRVTISAI